MADHTETIRKLYDAFGRGDIETVIGSFAPTIEWTEAAGFPYGGTYHGPQAVLEGVFMKLGTEWEGWQAVPRDFIAQGDAVVAIGDYSGTYKGTGKAFKTPFVHDWRIENGRVVRFTQHTDTVVVRRAME